MMGLMKQLTVRIRAQCVSEHEDPAESVLLCFGFICSTVQMFYASIEKCSKISNVSIPLPITLASS